MEPCNERLSGNRTCVERILALKEKIKVIYVGIKEPGTFIAKNEGQERLESSGVAVEFVGDANQITKVALAGHNL
jgi:pyrimidine deaminase RibD-like protein